MIARLNQAGRVIDRERASVAGMASKTKAPAAAAGPSGGAGAEASVAGRPATATSFRAEVQSASLALREPVAPGRGRGKAKQRKRYIGMVTLNRLIMQYAGDQPFAYAGGFGSVSDDVFLGQFMVDRAIWVEGMLALPARHLVGRRLLRQSTLSLSLKNVMLASNPNRDLTAAAPFPRPHGASFSDSASLASFGDSASTASGGGSSLAPLFEGATNLLQSNLDACVMLCPA